MTGIFPAANERTVLEWLTKEGIEVEFTSGHYGYNNIRPFWFKAKRGGRMSMAKTPWGAIKRLKRFEKARPTPQ